MPKPLKIILAIFSIFVIFTVIPFLFIKFILTPAVTKDGFAAQMTETEAISFFNKKSEMIDDLISTYKSQDFKLREITTDSIYWKPKDLAMQEMVDTLDLTSILLNEDSSITILIDKYWMLMYVDDNGFFPILTDADSSYIHNTKQLNKNYLLIELADPNPKLLKFFYKD